MLYSLLSGYVSSITSSIHLFLQFFFINHSDTVVAKLSFVLSFHAPFAVTVRNVFGGNQTSFLQVPSPAAPSAFDLLPESFLIFVMRIYLPLLNWRSLLGPSLCFVWDGCGLEKEKLFFFVILLVH